MSIIQVSQLCKTFQTFARREGVWGAFKDLFQRNYQALHAVDHISFSVAQGEIVGYIGPNGAGKSTTIKMLTGVLKPSGGSLEILGFHPFLQRNLYTKHIGVVFGQRTQLWWDIAVIESFRLLESMYDVPHDTFEKRLRQLSEILQLDELLNTPVRKLSLGQRLRCDLTASLLHGPKILFLDEPTIGLDAVAKDSIRTFLRQVNKEMKLTILLTTHDLREIEELCERIIIIDHGHLVYDGQLATVKNLAGLQRKATVELTRDTSLASFHENLPGSVLVTQEGVRRFALLFDPQQLSAVELIQNIVAHHPVHDITLAEADIEEVIMKIYRDGLSAENGSGA